MAKLLQAFDSEQHGEMANFDPVPANVYPMQITKSELCKTKDYDQTKHQFIKLELSIIGGEFKGRKVWTNLNIINKNQIAVKIANEELGAICKACGKPKIQDTEELHGIPMNVKLRIKAAKGDYPAQNIPAGYEPAGIQPAGKPGQKKVKKKLKEKAPVQTEASGPGWE